MAETMPMGDELKLPHRSYWLSHVGMGDPEFCLHIVTSHDDCLTGRGESQFWMGAGEAGTLGNFLLKQGPKTPAHEREMVLADRAYSMVYNTTEPNFYFYINTCPLGTGDKLRRAHSGFWMTADEVRQLGEMLHRNAVSYIGAVS